MSPVSSLRLHPSETPTRTTVRGVIVGIGLLVVASWNLWLGAALLVGELVFFGFLARKPEMRPYSRRVLTVAAITCAAVLLLMLAAGLLLGQPTSQP